MNDDKHKDAPELPEDWMWTACERCNHEWIAECFIAGENTGVYGTIGKRGIEIHVLPHPPDMDGDDTFRHEIPWTVLLAVKDRAIAEARTPAEDLIARAADLRTEDRFVTGDHVRYIGNLEWAAGAEGLVTGYSTAKHGYEDAKTQGVLVTWDEESARPGIAIEGRETYIESDQLEAVEVH